ncbi:MAG: lysophospholipase [Chloroflexota bacterium]|nr:lysophospholipase [Chloroflexota bacterium]
MTSTSATVPARDGTSLNERQWPAVGEPRGSVLIVHGLAEHSGRYERTGTILAATGLDVAGLDLRGFGASAGRRAYVSNWDVWLDDLEDRLAALRARTNGRPVVLLGHSMGGLVCLTYAESGRSQPDLLVLSSPWLADHLPKWRRAAARVLGRLVPRMAVANGFDGATLSRDPSVGAEYRVDPLAHHRTTVGLGRAVLLAQERALADLAKLHVQTLVIHGGADPLVPVTSSAVLASLPGVDRKVYPDLRHETLNEPEGPQIVADIAVWIGAQLGSRSPRA